MEYDIEATTGMLIYLFKIHNNDYDISNNDSDYNQNQVNENSKNNHLNNTDSNKNDPNDIKNLNNCLNFNMISIHLPSVAIERIISVFTGKVRVGCRDYHYSYHLYKYVCTTIYINTYICKCMHIYIKIHECIYVQIHIYIYAHM